MEDKQYVIEGKMGCSLPGFHQSGGRKLLVRSVASSASAWDELKKLVESEETALQPASLSRATVPSPPRSEKTPEVSNHLGIVERAKSIKTLVMPLPHPLSLPKTLMSPRRETSNGRPRLSRRVFVGGLSKHWTEVTIAMMFKEFGDLDVDWPYKKSEPGVLRPSKGFVFLNFKEEDSVHKVIATCHSPNGRGYCLNIIQHGKSNTQLQIRPWYISDALHTTGTVNEANAIFIGGVPCISARILATLMAVMFGTVEHTRIDTSRRFNYPKGSAKVTFKSQASTAAAIEARFVKLNIDNFSKMVEIKPYRRQKQLSYDV